MLKRLRPTFILDEVVELVASQSLVFDERPGELFLPTRKDQMVKSRVVPHDWGQVADAESGYSLYQQKGGTAIR